VFWLCIAERCCDLTASSTPYETGDLCSHVDGSEFGAGEGVVEMNAAVIGTPTCGQKTSLPGTESNSFDGGAMVPAVF
jgi:hypothetical protein